MKRLRRFEVLIPGTPHGQGRPRATRRGSHAGVYEGAKSRTRRADARDAIVRAMQDAGAPIPYIPEGPVRFTLFARFPCPKSAHRKTMPVPEIPHTGKPDIDNLLKLYMDAANELLYADDKQVASSSQQAVRAAQGVPPMVRIVVEAMS